ncbi:hypothetical protein Taro_012696 [Colocasia esculenta]|uniref:Uncharacterized protein n=1 Tax=Colocasia esculenta TaxID=4460 RepID=A0A843UEA3_COLES|nr:hypothetical protein [Colocasia esculenta]
MDSTPSHRGGGGSVAEGPRQLLPLLPGRGQLRGKHRSWRLLVEEAEDLRPVVLQGLVLNQPYFGGAKRTPSETASATIVPFVPNDLM